MFGLNVKIEDNTKDVERAAERAQFRTFKEAAYAIMQAARGSIERAPKGDPSTPGEPPHTRNRQYLRRAIRYRANQDGAVIGPAYSVVGQAGHIHEFGGQYGFAFYPERPFMRPALESEIDRFANSWSGSVHA